MRRAPLSLFAALLALGIVAILLAGAVPASLRGPAAWGALFLVPLIAGALGTALVRPWRRPSARAEVQVPTLPHAPMVVALILIDGAALGLGHALGWVSFSPAGAALSPLRLAVGVLALPAVMFVAVIGSEWALRARLYAAWAALGRPRTGAAAAVLAGVALAAAAVVPGFRLADRAFVVAALTCLAAREIAAVALYRRAGVLLSGTFRGAIAGLEALVLGDRLAAWAPAATYAASAPEFYALRAATAVAAAALALFWVARLTRRDAELRRPL